MGASQIPSTDRGDERLNETHAPIRIETFTSLEQFDQCVVLEEAVWGYDPGRGLIAKRGGPPE